MSAYSLHIGVNTLSTTHYASFSGQLLYADKDAASMAQLAKQAGVAAPKVITNLNAKREVVVDEIKALANKANPGDLVIITFSGHGGRLPNATNNTEGTEGQDDAWCCHDGMVLDDELLACWIRFRAGVRIVLVSDSCFSGTIAKELEEEEQPDVRIKALPANLVLETYKKQKAKYDQIRAALGAVSDSAIKASVFMIAACREDKTAAELNGHGYLTGTIVKVWNNGSWNGNYYDLYNQVAGNMPGQLPVSMELGPNTKALFTSAAAFR